MKLVYSLLGMLLLHLTLTPNVKQQEPIVKLPIDSSGIYFKKEEDDFSRINKSIRQMDRDIAKAELKIQQLEKEIVADSVVVVEVVSDTTKKKRGFIRRVIDSVR